MVFNKYKISSLLLVSVSLFMLFVVLMTIVSYLQTSKIQKNVDILYNHPLTVRRALGNIKADLYIIHWQNDGLMEQSDIVAMKPFIDQIRKAEERFEENFAILKAKYLGPKQDLDSLYSLFLACKHDRADAMNLMMLGKFDETRKQNIHFQKGPQSAHLKELLGALEVISAFSLNKGDELHGNSIMLHKKLTRQLVSFAVLMLLVSLIIYYVLIQSIRQPLSELTKTSLALQAGDLSARSWVNSENEFGSLSQSMNLMAASVQYSARINEMVVELTNRVLQATDLKDFSDQMLVALANLTQSQIAAIYLLNQEKTSFELNASLGADSSIPKAFAYNTAEGEFGMVLKSGKMQHIQAVSASHPFQYKAVTGVIQPNEIITLPLLNGTEVFGVVSLATIQQYSTHTLEFMQRVSGELSARTYGMLAFSTLSGFSELLSRQNGLLENQKQALVEQSEELLLQNQELEIQKKQLDEANRLKTNFLSNMSHELRTPLNSVIALSGVLNRRLAKQIPEEEYSYIGVIERNGKHLLALINDILDISRIEAGREELVVSTFNVCQQIDEVVQMIKPLADAKGLQLQRAKGDCQISLSSDADKFRHILQNLIGNAVKFTEQGSVEIRVALLENEVQVEVLDSGIGISENQLPHIFEEFRQADSSTSRKYGGTGLGLAIARKYAQMLGGSLQVHSKPNMGSTFVLSLPIQAMLKDVVPSDDLYKSASLSRLKKPEAYLGAKTRKTVMIIEDSEPAVVQIKDVLGGLPIDVMVFNAGNPALAWASVNHVDAVILDLMMPKMDGFEVLKELRNLENTRTVPVLILTAKHITADELRFLKGNHISQLIQKGDVNRIELLQSVKQMVYPTKQLTDDARVSNTDTSEKPLLLVVEDNLDNLLTVKALLADSYEVIEANNGLEAVAKARTQRPDLILMDIALPEMDGIEAFKIIHKDAVSQHIPIIALTASAMTSDRETILAYGFDAYIAKPIDETHFFNTINATLYGK